MNKRFLYAYIMTLFCTVKFASAQIITEDTTSREPFFKAKKFDSKCYVGMEAIPTQILKTKAAMNLRFNINWVVNHRYVVSGYYYTLTSPVNIRQKVEPTQGNAINLVHHSAGLSFGYIFFHSKKFSFQPEISGGWGYMKYEVNGSTRKRHFGIISPAVYGIYNASTYFRFGIGLNYRTTIKANLIKDSELSGVGGVVFIRVGTF